MTKRKPEVEERELSDLHPFPRQAEFFDDLSDHDLEQLAADIKRNGLKQRIDVLPENSAGLNPNTILRGHQRRLALEILGYSTYAVRVRYDLAGSTAADIERFFLDDNLNRRQLDPLAKVRVALRRFEIDKGHRLNGHSAQQEGEVRDWIGKVLGMSGRNVDRYKNVLSSPVEVQEALRTGKLPLVQAAKVGGLPTKLKAKIAARIADGEDARAVVQECLPAKKASARSADDSLRSLLKSLVGGHSDLAGRLDEISAGLLKRSLKDLRSGAALLRDLVAKAEAGG
jgi:ParB-like chromosome segregation protein Spo0J